MPKTIAGALVGSALGAYGKKPVIPELPTLDTGKIQQQAIAGNIAALPGLEDLTSKVNKFSFDQVSQMLEAAIPGFRASLAKAGENAASLLKGEVPEDVSRTLTTSAAARSLAGGFAGTGFHRNLLARDLGLTSLSLMGEGQNRLTSLGSFATSAFPRFDFTTAFITPQQKLAFEWQQNLAQFNRNLLAAQVKAAPNPNDVALAEGLDNFFETWKNVGMGALGGGGGFGGMMGGGGGGGSPTTAQASAAGSASSALYGF